MSVGGSSSAIFSYSSRGSVVAGAAVTWVLRTANSAPALSSYKQKNPGSLTEVFASDGKTRLGFIQSDDLVQPVAASQIPKVLKEATVAIEDERFYKHKGVDYEGIIRAAVKNATEHKTVQGGSTLTMQLVRILYTQDDTRGGHRRLQAQDPRGQARPRPRGGAPEELGPGQVPQHGALRHRRRPVGDRRRRRRAPVLRQARAGPDAARGRDAGRHAAGAVPLLAGAQPERHEEAPQRGAGQDGRARLHHARDRAEGDEEGPRPAHGALLPEGPRALRPRLRPVRADQGVRPQERPARRLAGLHDDRPQEAEGGARGDRRQDGRHRSVVGDRLDRPRERRHRRDGLLH